MRFLASLRYDTGGRHLGLHPTGNNDIPASLEMHFERLYAFDSSSPHPNLSFSLLLPLLSSVLHYRRRSHRCNVGIAAQPDSTSVKKPAPSPCRRVDETADLPEHPVADRIHFHQQFMPPLGQGDQAAVVESATELLLLPIPHHPILSPLQQQHRHPRL